MYTPSDARLEWLGEGSLFKTDSNKRWTAKMKPLFESFPEPLLKSGVGPLARHGNHQEIMSMGLKHMYTSKETKLEWPEEVPFFELGSNKHGGGGGKGQNVITTNYTTFAI